MGRLILILLVGVGAYLLPPRGESWRLTLPGLLPSAAAQTSTEFRASGPCPTHPAYPAETEVVVLPHQTAGYGAIQYPRTPLPPRTIALTFDDGPDWRGDPRVFEILEERCVTATFFYVGLWARMHPHLVREAIARGHGVASHSWSHPTQLRYWSAAGARTEIDRGFSALYEAAGGAENVEPFFRFPGLNDSPALRGWMAGQGITSISAEGGTDDWRGLSASAIIRRTVANMEASNGGVLILHETRPAMVQALPELMDELTRRGFRFVRISAGGRRAAYVNRVSQPGGEGTLATR
ncbi:polysaccharide deacetylase family protein [Brevundimonas sp.]|uniref:polysaccharide deacetylase family protein n=1 Tax=Brevundimonas sp. TaxID=1871086 RepID=UPI0025DCF59F|nr:polysaccharide deacetylase family protein [Brevundimonas sp.]